MEAVLCQLTVGAGVGEGEGFINAPFGGIFAGIYE
jgi:hypothetical protein